MSNLPSLHSFTVIHTTAVRQSNQSQRCGRGALTHAHTHTHTPRQKMICRARAKKNKKSHHEGRRIVRSRIVPSSPPPSSSFSSVFFSLRLLLLLDQTTEQTMSQQKVKSVTFIQQLKKSWKVTYTGVNFKNERGAHVETNGWQPKLNTPYPLPWCADRQAVRKRQRGSFLRCERCQERTAHSTLHQLLRASSERLQILTESELVLARACTGVEPLE